MIVRGTQELKKAYHRLRPGDTVIGQIVRRKLEHAMMIDLLERNVACFPSALSQMLSRSKASQASLLASWMLPATLVITRGLELIDAINLYNRQGIGRVVTKDEHKHCGHGVRQWENMEVLYSHLGLDDNAYPFVLQPLAQDFADVRAIICGDYIEAYQRKNPYNFRSNIAAGGSILPFSLKDPQVRFCGEIMDRGKFPYAHVDLMIFGDGRIYLSEIALNGGTKGARISQKDLEQKKKQILERLAAHSQEGLEDTL